MCIRQITPFLLNLCRRGGKDEGEKFLDHIKVTVPKRLEEGPASQSATGVPNTEPLASVDRSDFAVRKASRLYLVSKQLFDFVMSLVGIILLLPVFIIIALCIKLDHGGPGLPFRGII